MTIPKRIDQGWLDQMAQRLTITRKELNDGSLNPSYVELQSEIEQAQEDKDRWDRFAAWVSSQYGARINQYPVRTADGRRDPGTCFFSKAENKVWTIEQAYSAYQSSDSE